MELPPPVIRDWDYPRGTASIVLMARFAAENGVEGLESYEHAPVDGQVDARQELAVVRALVRGLGGEDGVALRLSRRYRVSAFGIFGFACISSPTLGDAMRFALRYLDLSFTFCIPHVTVEAGRLALDMDDSRVPGDVARFLLLRDLGAIHTVMRDILPDISLRSLAFRHDKPSTVDEYVRTFGLVPSFSATSHVATLDPLLLDKPLPQANDQTVAVCAAQCELLVSRKRERSGIAQQVRERLVRLGGVDAGMEEVARQLAVSPRTLRRRLFEAGTGYRALLDEVRQALAEEMLDTGALTVEDVALRLGYAEASSFIYAFKRWKGMTPAAYARRNALRARPGR
ncbi:AraC family transcriptional regulator ligand-binding domain-containing protein [Amycolatopsis japonica]|uniref:AraC family transcriptional regulator n=1 Tax=Amycolatopsis japonica TaxID=208439 RepID=UPI00332804A6